MNIGNRLFDMNSHHTYVMGILNVTPDSFSDGGSYYDKENASNMDAALRHVEQMVKEGADIVDVGGESTRPGHEVITVQEEIDRVCGVIRAIKERVDVPVSIDTYKVPVARAALEAGADMVNDIWGLRYDQFNDVESSDTFSGRKMAELVSEKQVPICLMHNDNLGRNLEDRTDKVVVKYLEANSMRSAVELLSSIREEGVIDRVIWGLMESVDIARKSGINKDNIIVDPGIGFAKTQRENLLTTKFLKKIVSGIDYPVLYASSRKSMIGTALDLPADQREEGTIVTTVLAAEAGCRFVRVHDVEKNVRSIKMIEAIQG